MDERSALIRRSLIGDSRSSHLATAHFASMSGNSNQRTVAGRTSGLRSRLVVAVLIAMLAFPAFAAAQGSSPTQDQYDDIPQSTAAGGGSGSGDPGGTGLGDPVGPLPFTGFDVIAMIAVALAVTGVGLALQRAVGRESTDEL